MDELTQTTVIPETPDTEINSGFDFDVTAGFNSNAEAEAAITNDVAEVQTDTEPAADTPTIESEPEDRNISFTAKIDHKETPITIKESEIATYYQKAQNMDRAVQRESDAQAKIEKLNSDRSHLAAVAKAAMGVEGDNPDEILANVERLMTDTAVKSKVNSFTKTDPEIAEAHVRLTLKDTIDQSMSQFEAAKVADMSADASASDDTTESDGGESERPFSDFASEVEKLIAIRPDIQGKSFPPEVISAFKFGGQDLITAYAQYEAKQVAAENAELKKQNAILQQNQASAQKAPIRSGVAGSAAVDLKDDPWTAGFNSKRW